MSLEEKLASIRAESAEMFPDDVKEKFKRAGEELVASGIKDRALSVGDTAPSFSLPDTSGDMVDSSDLLKEGPLVIAFYRGVW